VLEAIVYFRQLLLMVAAMEAIGTVAMLVLVDQAVAAVILVLTEVDVESQAAWGQPDKAFRAAAA
jgi:hypothetical protein